MWPKDLFLVILCIGHISGQLDSIRYVKPSNYSLNCPGQPCLTLEQFAQQRSDQFFNSGSIFQFLAGNHSLQNSISLKNLSNISFIGEALNFSDFKVVCMANIWCENVSKLTVEGLMFIFHYSDSEVQQTLFQIFQGSRVLMRFSAFRGNENSSKFFRAIHVTRDSILKIEGCLFEMNSADYGGVIYGRESNITITSSIFISSQARFSGGAIFSKISILVIEDSFFQL